MNMIAINNQQLPIREYQGQRVVTFKDIDAVHERPEGTAKRNFLKNASHFIEGADYYNIFLKDEFRTLGLDVPNRGILAFTLMGYLMLTKSFKDDLAWQVQRRLVTSYFQLQQSQTEQPQQLYTLHTGVQAEIGSIAERVARQTVEESLVNYKPIPNNIEETVKEALISIRDKAIAKMDTVAYVEKQPTMDYMSRKAVQRLVELSGDNSYGFNLTYRKVYQNMPCDWRYRRSRYKNKKGYKNLPIKLKMIQEDGKLFNMFIDTVNNMITEYEQAESTTVKG